MVKQVDGSGQKAPDERYKALIEYARELIFIIAEDGSVLYESPSCKRLLGCTLSELYTKHGGILNVVHPDDQEKARIIYRQVTSGETDEAIFEFRHIRPDGGYIDLETTLTNGRKNPAIGGIIATSRDITDRKQAEQELRESEHRLRTIVTHAPLILFALDRDGIYMASEGAGLATLGRQPGAIVGQSVFDVYGAYPDLIGYTKQALAGTAVTFVSYVSGATFDNWMVPFYDDAGVIAGVIGVSTDITARRKAEDDLQESTRKLEQSNAELQRFAYIASHDLQEPLRTITSYLQLLSRDYAGRLDADADEFINFAVNGAKRMRALIQGVLDYSRIDASTAEPGPVDCGELVHDAVANLRVKIEETGAKIVWQELPTVLGDAQQLGQLMQNLLGNALKFCHGAPDIAIQAMRADDGDMWTISVHDHGIGIAPRDVEHIFDMFGRLHSQGEYEGSGIGLSVCKKIVEQHGGRMGVESEVDVGTTFSFTLPAYEESIIPAKNPD